MNIKVSEHNYQILVSSLGLGHIVSLEVIQPLWSNCGYLVRVYCQSKSLIIKHIELPKQIKNAKGWSSRAAYQRKLRSYHVEMRWYTSFAKNNIARVPQTLMAIDNSPSLMLVMEDLQSSGFTQTIESAQKVHLQSCLKWLASFHAQHIQNTYKGLWENGTYWHLATRRDELKALDDPALKKMAGTIDSILTRAPFPTLVHGDAKLANFCFTADGKLAAAVDFQYVGRGCAMKDIVLFMSSAVAPNQCVQMEPWILNQYFSYLKKSLEQFQPHLSPADVEAAWRPLFPVAWADFQRFIKGWCPSHWKINDYTESLTKMALKYIEDNCL